MGLTSARLRAFGAVAEEGSYSAAARRLRLSQPAVSKAVQELETAFGVTLFERRGRSMVPTDLALELGPVAAEMERVEAEALRILRRRAMADSGTLRIGLGNSMPGIALIGAFQRRMPKVHVQVEFGNSAAIIDAVLENRVDVGMLPNVPDDRRFLRKTCLVQKVVAVIPNGHRLAGAASVALAELASERLIFRTPGSSTQRVVDRAFRQAGLEVRPAMLLETRDGVCEAVANGLGIGFIWRYGTSRSDGFSRVPVAEINDNYEEVLFHRTDSENRLAALFVADARPTPAG
ncbi:LysR substrate-binding domain-containing protein [Marinibaculum pumilum]|uniref:LysR substrate-binding domain-containing protein n=1 Tax=Marinibaculum pumilum TaxID=1766165 RepID=A0ABV7L032_9PROT